MTELKWKSDTQLKSIWYTKSAPTLHNCHISHVWDLIITEQTEMYNTWTERKIKRKLNTRHLALSSNLHDHQKHREELVMQSFITKLNNYESFLH